MAVSRYEIYFLVIDRLFIQESSHSKNRYLQIISFIDTGRNILYNINKKCVNISYNIKQYNII